MEEIKNFVKELQLMGMPEQDILQEVKDSIFKKGWYLAFIDDTQYFAYLTSLIPAGYRGKAWKAIDSESKAYVANGHATGLFNGIIRPLDSDEVAALLTENLFIDDNR